MATKCAAGRVMVNAGFVSGEILVDDERTLDWAILVDFAHDGMLIGRQAIRTLAIVLVGGEIGPVAVLTVVNAFWRFTLFARARGSIALGMMLARFNNVWLAALFLIELK